MAFSDSLQKVRQLPEGKRRFFMLLSMLALSFLVLAIAWKSFERNLGMRLGAVSQENGIAAPGPLQSLAEDMRRIARGEEPVMPEWGIRNNESGEGWLEKIFSAAREMRLVIGYNFGEIQKWLLRVQQWFIEVLW